MERLFDTFFAVFRRPLLLDHVRSALQINARRRPPGQENDNPKNFLQIARLVDSAATFRHQDVHGGWSFIGRGSSTPLEWKFTCSDPCYQLGLKDRAALLPA
jgi:hypothetical protein